MDRKVTESRFQPIALSLTEAQLYFQYVGYHGVGLL